MVNDALQAKFVCTARKTRTKRGLARECFEQIFQIQRVAKAMAELAFVKQMRCAVQEHVDRLENTNAPLHTP